MISLGKMPLGKNVIGEKIGETDGQSIIHLEEWDFGQEESGNLVRRKLQQP